MVHEGVEVAGVVLQSHWRLVGELRDAAVEELQVLRMPTPVSEIEERYHCDSNGTIEVDLVNITEGYQRTYRLQGRAA